MEQKKIVIMAAAMLIILAGAFAYLGMKDRDKKDASPSAENDIQTEEDSSIADPYSEESPEELEETGNGGFAALEQLVDAYPNMDFTTQQDTSFEWMTGSGDSPQRLTGKSIEAYGIAGHVDLKNFFEKAGFEEDLDNAADGTTNGQQGFSDGEIVCLYEYTSKGESEDEIDGGSLIYDIKISCAEVSQE